MSLRADLRRIWCYFLIGLNPPPVPRFRCRAEREHPGGTVYRCDKADGHFGSHYAKIPHGAIAWDTSEEP